MRSSNVVCLYFLLLPALSTVAPCHGQQLCSQLSVDESTSPVFSCFIPFTSLSETKKYKVSRLVAYSDSCPAYVSSTRDLELSATGTCGGGGGVAGPDCPPVFSSRISLQGTGPDYDQYTQLFEAVAQTRFYTGLWFCITLSEAYTSWSQTAWNCRQMYPGDECPPAMEAFGGINAPPVASSSGSSQSFATCSVPGREIFPAGAKGRPSLISIGDLSWAEITTPAQREFSVEGMTARRQSRRGPGSGSSTQP